MAHRALMTWGLVALLVVAATAVMGTGPAESGMDSEIWIAVRTDGQPGTGTANDPYDGSTQERFDAVMHGLYAANRTHVSIHLGVGTFPTLGSYVYLAHNPKPGWVADEGWKISGAGMGNTVLELAGFTYEDPTLYEVAVAGGRWTSRADRWLEPNQELRLVAGSGLTGLELQRVYYAREIADARHFRVAATLDGPTLADCSIATGGQFRVVTRDAWNTVVANRPWNKCEVEVKDLTIDGNWTGFGTTLTEEFTVPGEQETVTASVESSAWAIPNRRVYLQQTDYRVVGVYEVVGAPNPGQIVLRNAARQDPPAPRQPDLRFRDNLPRGTRVPAGTRLCPRLNVGGIGISAPRCRVERVRVTNTGAPIYEGNCGINVVGIGAPGPDNPEASDIVIRDCIVDNIWGEFGWPIQVQGNNSDLPSRGYGTQALVEGNTIRGNGLHQGLGGWNYINSFWLNNKVTNCAPAFFTDVGNCWNNVVSGNLFLECRKWPIIVGGGPGAWSRDRTYQVGDIIYVDDVSYTCKAAHSGHAPPDEQYWQETARPALCPYDRYVFESNLIEVCDGAGALLFNGNVSNTIFRDNILRYAPGWGRGSRGLDFSNPTNRRLIVTDNLIDSRLENAVGSAVVFGKDNIDELGRLRPELERRQASEPGDRQQLPQ